MYAIRSYYVGQLGNGFGIVHVAGLAVHLGFRRPLGFLRLGLVYVLGTNGGVRQHGHVLRLHLQHTAGDVHQLFGSVQLDQPHNAGLA